LVLNQDHNITVVGEDLGYSDLRRALDAAEGAPHVVLLDEDAATSAVINGLGDRVPRTWHRGDHARRDTGRANEALRAPSRPSRSLSEVSASHDP
jgi:hypothetical protein